MFLFYLIISQKPFKINRQIWAPNKKSMQTSHTEVMSKIGNLSDIQRNRYEVLL